MSSEAATQGHPKGLAHHFETFEQQKESSFLGMWLFISQELMFFGGIFAAYVNYRVLYPDAFIAGSQQLDVGIGAANTIVLLCSSFTMVYAVWVAQSGYDGRHFRRLPVLGERLADNRWQIVLGLVGTLFFGTIFLVVKYFEYGSKFAHHLVPHWDFIPPVSSIPEPETTEIFFSLYFAMTGLHGLHMVVGMGIMVFMMIPMALRGAWDTNNHNFIEGFGLYWHFVDIVWIFLFPFLYLVGESVGKIT
ncbi:MAG: cytochrome c oxidase subunit 3 family protein [Acidobacteriota bacterium]